MKNNLFSKGFKLIIISFFFMFLGPTLMFQSLKNEDHPDGKFINYHAGPAPEVLDVCKKVYPLIVSENTDPLFTLQKYLPLEQLVEISDDCIIQLQREVS